MHKAVSDALSRSFRDVEIEFDVSNGKLLAFLSAKGEVISTDYNEKTVVVHVRMPQKYLGRIESDDIRITESNPPEMQEPDDGNDSLLANNSERCENEPPNSIDDVA